jgi:hypothetical protein
LHLPGLEIRPLGFRPRSQWLCMYKGWTTKTSPCIATFEDLLHSQWLYRLRYAGCCCLEIFRKLKGHLIHDSRSLGRASTQPLHSRSGANSTVMFGVRSVIRLISNDTLSPIVREVSRGVTHVIHYRYLRTLYQLQLCMKTDTGANGREHVGKRLVYFRFLENH